MKTRNGQVLIGAVFVLIIVTLLGMIAASMISTESYSGIVNLRGIQAMNVAEAGMRFTVATSLAADADFTDNFDFGPINFGPGSFTVQYKVKQLKGCTLEVTGTVQGVSRKMSARFRKGGMLDQFSEYGAYGGDSGGAVGKALKFQDESKIIGNLYFYGPVEILVSTHPCQASGVIRSVSIDPAAPGGIPGHYASWEPAAAVTAVVWNDTYYANLIATSNTTTAALSLTDTKLTLDNEVRKYASITLNTTSEITGTGTLFAKSDFSMNGSSKLTGKIMIVAKGSASIGGSSTTRGTIEVIAGGSFAVSGTAVASTEKEFYSHNAFTLTDATIRGSAMAPYGQFDNKGGHMIGLTYADAYDGYTDSTLEGGSVFESIGFFHQASMLIQNQRALPTKLPNGFTSEVFVWEVSNWGEVF